MKSELKDVETWSPQKHFHFERSPFWSRYGLGSNTVRKKRNYTGESHPCGKRVAEARTLVWVARPESWATQGQGDTCLALEFAIEITLELTQAKIVWTLLIATFPAGLLVEWSLPASLMSLLMTSPIATRQAYGAINCDLTINSLSDLSRKNSTLVFFHRWSCVEKESSMKVFLYYTRRPILKCLINSNNKKYCQTRVDAQMVKLMLFLGVYYASKALTKQANMFRIL